MTSGGAAADLRGCLYAALITLVGCGAGLAVVREITHSMFGGTVKVESLVGEGSTFTLALPIPPQRSGEVRGG